MSRPVVAKSDPRPAAAVHVGTPPSAFQDWETVNVYYHNFADLGDGDCDGDGFVKSPLFSCLGHQWCLWFGLDEVAPGGEENIWLALFLEKKSCGDIAFNFGLSKIATTST